MSCRDFPSPDEHRRLKVRVNTLEERVYTLETTVEKMLARVIFMDRVNKEKEAQRHG